ncbi:MAG TPA: hypothetical protein VM782_08055, partial [Stellaceae bacterium]|nr:hypothetical protein [Stellaceae bacterium]
MPQTTEITFGADVSQAVDAINTLQDRLTGLSRQVRESLQAMRSADAAYVAAFKTNMQIMVDAKQLSLQQALGFDIDYTAKVFEQEQARLAAIRDSDRTALGERLATTEAMRAAEERYVTQISGEYRKLADAARSEADRIARSYEQAFDRIGGTVQRSFNQILTGQTTWAKGMTRITQEVESFFLDQVESMAAKWAASGLASLAGDAVSGAVKGAQATGSNGLGAGLAALLGLNQPGGLLGTGLFSGAGTTATAASEAAAVTANTTALGASTAAMTALTTALGGATAAS